MHQLNLFNDAQSMMDEATKKQKEANQLSKESSELITRAQGICVHENKRISSTYFEGGYDYHAHTTYVEKCVLCGKMIREWDKDHGYFG